MLRLFHIVLVLGNRVKILKLPLYSIQFLHQITTVVCEAMKRGALYSIQFLHQITTEIDFDPNSYCCIVSNFYIKSQRSALSWMLPTSCIVSNFYIKSQQDTASQTTARSCIVSNFYIKSQPCWSNSCCSRVV